MHARWYHFTETRIVSEGEEPEVTCSSFTNTLTFSTSSGSIHRAQVPKTYCEGGFQVVPCVTGGWGGGQDSQVLKEILRYPEICPPQAGNFGLFKALECDFALISGVQTALRSGYGLSSLGGGYQYPFQVPKNQIPNHPDLGAISRWDYVTTQITLLGTYCNRRCNDHDKTHAGASYRQVPTLDSSL